MESRRQLKLIAIAVLLIIMFPGRGNCDDNADKKLSTAANCFTLNFYKQLAKSKGSLVSSPFSSDVLLSILRVGAAGKTAEQLTTGLGYNDLSVSDMEDAFKSKLTQLTSSSGNTLEVGNSVWIQDNFEIQQNFKDAVVNNFDAEVESLDFQGDPQGATETINAWGNAKTHGLIPSLFDGPLDTETVMVLVNAIYFKGEWASMFEKERTRDGDFYNNGSKNKPSKVKLMRQYNRFKYSFDNSLNAQILEMDYKGGDMSMLIILPASDSEIENLEGALTCDNFRNALISGKDTPVIVTMPKFDITSSFNLVQPIANIGIDNIFEGTASFPGIAPGITVSKAVQKAIIKVYEEGSEAAALTGKASSTSVRADRPKIVEFKADHPFLFMIKNKATDLILFIGRASDLPDA